MLLGSLVGLALVAGVLVSVFGSGATYQYAFTNLSPEDASEAAAALKAAGMTFRSEANGAALAVPASQVHDARLAAAMYFHGIRHILTLNRSDFDRFEGVTVLHPAAVV